MRYLSADIIYPVHTKPLTEHVLVIQDDGEVVDCKPTVEFSTDQVERLHGALTPGFINTHCHIELSHLKNKFPERTGLGEFLLLVTKQREEKEEVIEQAMSDAEQEMIGNGIVAVCDISNTAHSFRLKSKRNLYYHTFVEIFTLDPNRAMHAFNGGKELQDQANHFGLHTSLAPHAPYSVSPELLKLISNDCLQSQQPTTFHMLESNDENEFYVQGSGLIRKLYRELNIPIRFFEPTGKTSLESTLPYLDSRLKTLLVHNTIATPADIDWAEHLHSQLFWCLCPNANLFIEDRLPDIPMLSKHGRTITVGTDSLSSNHRLSVFDELKTIAGAYPSIPFEELIRWSTINGAGFLGIDSQFGSFEKGKRPGVNLITNLADGKLSSASRVQKIV